MRLPDGSLAALEQERWASPLGDEFRQALLEELVARAHVVEGRPVAPGAAPPVRVGIDVRRFDSLLGREARIEGSWTLSPARPRPRRFAASGCIGSRRPAGLPELAAAHRRALVRLADAIGDALLALRRGSTPACPASDPR